MGRKATGLMIATARSSYDSGVANSLAYQRLAYYFAFMRPELTLVNKGFLLMQKLAIYFIVILVFIGIFPAVVFADLKPERKEQLEQSIADDPAAALTIINQQLKQARAEDLKIDIFELMIFRAQALIQLGYTSELLSLSERGLEMAKAQNNKKYQIEFTAAIAEAHELMGKMEDARHWMNEAESQALELNDEKLLHELQLQAADIYYRSGMYETALEKLTSAYDYFESKNDEREMATALSSFAMVYDATGEWDKSVEYYKRAFALIDSDNKNEVSIFYYNIGLALYRQEEFKESEIYLEKARKLSEELNDSYGESFALSLLGAIDNKNGDKEGALNKYRSAYFTVKQVGDTAQQFSVGMRIVAVYRELKNFDSAVDYLREIETLDGQLAIERTKVNFLREKAKLLSAMGNHREGYQLLDQYVELKEKIEKSDKEKQTATLKLKFDTELKDAENELLQKENELQRLTLEESKYQTYLQVSLLSLAVVVIFFMVMAHFKSKKIRQKLAELALTDELTGAPNRRHIMNIAEEELQRSHRYDVPTSVGVVDLDFFKNINDTHGHDVGDEVLKAFSRVVKSQLREQDKFGRIGGEEWLLVLPHTEKNDVDLVVSRVRREMEKIKISGLDKTTTFSMGITQIQPDDEQLNDVLKRADLALYEAKNSGRNTDVYH